MKEKWHKWLPYIFMLLTALSRWPGLFPSNFSALYGLAFCAGAFFPGRMKWWLPFGTLLVSDVCLDFYYLHKGYNVFDIPLLKYQCFNYVAFAVLVLLIPTFSLENFISSFSTPTDILPNESGIQSEGQVSGAISLLFLLPTLSVLTILWLMRQLSRLPGEERRQAI